MTVPNEHNAPMYAQSVNWRAFSMLFHDATMPKLYAATLPTARWRAHDIRSVAAAARLLFVAHKKKVSLCT